MNTRIIVPVILSAVMLSTPVLAAGRGAVAPSNRHIHMAAATTPIAKCTALEKQFDAAIKMHWKAAKAGEAKTMRAYGGDLCASGNQTEGIAKLEQALKDLGVKAKS